LQFQNKLLPGVTLKQFTARDVVSRWDVVVEAHQWAGAAGCSILNTLQSRMPVPIRVVQVDGGSEFFAEFEAACQSRGIRLFEFPSKSPKLNGGLERANRTHTEEFYEVYDCTWTVEGLNPQLARWERIYNTIWPHQALGYLTPEPRSYRSPEDSRLTDCIVFGLTRGIGPSASMSRRT
jgi:hypothetical protein